MKSNGLDLVSLVTVVRLKDARDRTFRDELSTTGKSSREAITAAAQDAHALGLRVMLVPHLLLDNGTWRGDMVLAGVEDADRFFAGYGSYLEDLARVAESACVEVLSLGVELKGTSGVAEHDGRWAALIKRVRRVFRGVLIYSANWDEVEQVRFTPLLDAVGVNAFWPLHDTPGATPEVMASGARRVAGVLGTVSRKSKKPVMIVEFGYKGVKDSAIRPWEWPDEARVDSLPGDPGYQAAAYHAFLCAVAKEPWLMGAAAWMVTSDMDDVNRANRWEGPHGFSPLGKPAEDVLSSFCGVQKRRKR
jgi:hypothetical protein